MVLTFAKLVSLRTFYLGDVTPLLKLINASLPSGLFNEQHVGQNNNIVQEV